MKSPITIFALTKEFFPTLKVEDRIRLLEAVYAFCLNIENHHYLDRRMKDIGIEYEVQIEFKRRLKYNKYAKCDFWRGISAYFRGKSPDTIKICPTDLKFCLHTLTDDQYIKVMRTASFKSTHRISDKELHSVIDRAKKTCKTVADRQLRWITQTDPSFCGREELEDEAIRVAHYYAHFPDTSRISAYIVRAIYNKANHLCEYHSAESRRRQRKLPAFKCDECHSKFVHRKKAKTFNQVVDKIWPKATEDAEVYTCINWGAKPKEGEIAVFCTSCLKTGDVVRLTPIEGERVYETMVISMDAKLDEDGRNLADRLPDSSSSVERKVQQKLDLEKITQKLKPSTAEFVRILVDGDAGFEEWAMDRGIKALIDPLVTGHLICEYLDISFDAVKKETGQVIGKPSVFVVRADGEEDMVCAQTAKEAVHNVAKHYRFKDGYDMEDALGKIQVKRIGEMGGSLGMKVGDIAPVA